MGFLDVLVAFRRLWYATLAGLVLVGLVSWQVANPEPVYWSRTEVTLMLPASDRNPNALVGGTASLIVAAGVLAKDLEGGSAAEATSSSEVPLTGLGVRHGYSVVLPNVGGQWAYNFDRAALIVQVVGTSEAEVRARFDEVLKAIGRHLTAREDAAQVAASDRIRFRAVPANPQVLAETGHRTQALGVSLILGASLVAALVLFMERRLNGRQARSQPAPRQAPASA